jgi:hypothetical protein
MSDADSVLVSTVPGRRTHAATSCYGQWWALSAPPEAAPRRAGGGFGLLPNWRTASARAMARPGRARAVKGVPVGTGRRSALDHPGVVWHRLGPRRVGPSY